MRRRRPEGPVRLWTTEQRQNDFQLFGQKAGVEVPRRSSRVYGVSQRPTPRMGRLLARGISSGNGGVPSRTADGRPALLLPGQNLFVFREGSVISPKPGKCSSKCVHISGTPLLSAEVDSTFASRSQPAHCFDLPFQ